MDATAALGAILEEAEKLSEEKLSDSQKLKQLEEFLGFARGVAMAAKMAGTNDRTGRSDSAKTSNGKSVDQVLEAIRSDADGVSRIASRYREAHRKTRADRVRANGLAHLKD